MSARALRKLRGEDALAAALAGSGDESGSSDEEDDAPPPRAINLFGMLGDEDGEGDDGSDSDSDGDGDRGAADGAAAAATVAAATSSGEGESSKRKKKRKKKKSKKGKEKAEEDPDSVEAALRDLNIEPVQTVVPGAGDAGTGAGAPSDGAAARQQRTSCLGADVHYFKADEEMRRLFGAQTIRDARAEDHAEAGGLRRRLGGAPAAARRGAGADSRGKAAAAALRATAAQHRRRKCVLVNPADEWPRLSPSLGLTMRSVGDAAPADFGGCGGRVFRYEHSHSYASTQGQYEAYAASGDPNLIAMLLRQNPYHVEALLGMSELYKSSGEGTAAGELLERALYALEAAFHPWLDVGAGDCRLEYSIEANKPLFNALFRQCQLLNRRGTHRSAFESCRLLLSLDPSDPMGALLMGDFLAHRARQFTWVLQMVEEMGSKCALLLMPNWALTVPLARLRLLAGDGGEEAAATHAAGDTEEDALEQLSHGLLLHPYMLVRVAAKARLDEGDARWKSLLARAPFAGAELGLASASADRLSSVAAERQQLLWKAPDAASWLRRAAERAADHAEGGARANADWPSMADWVAARDQAFPPGVPNAYTHLNPADFGDNFLALPPQGLNEEEPEGDFADEAEQRAAIEAVMQQQALAAAAGQQPDVQEGEGALQLLLRSLFDPALANDGEALAAQQAREDAADTGDDGAGPAGA